MEREFNVNDYVRVKLKPSGHKLHAEHWRRFGLSGPEIKEDAEGWSRWQMWDFMSIFGEHISLGGIPPFETTIRIEFPNDGATK